MIEDACAIIVQAAAFAAAEILHKEESSVSSRAGRIVVVRVRHSVHNVYRCLGSSYFQRAYRMSYKKFWNLHSKLATRINLARLAMRRYVPKGGRKGGKLKAATHTKWASYDKCSSCMCPSILCRGFRI